MTLEEDLLRGFLQERTPQPPRILAADDVTRHLRADHQQTRPWRRGLAVAFAAAAVAALAIGVAWISRSHTNSQPAGPTLSPIPSLSLSTTNRPPSPSSALVPAGQVIGPWDAQTVGGEAAHAVPVAAIGTTVYARRGSTLLAIDSKTGIVSTSVNVSDDFVLTLGPNLLDVPLHGDHDVLPIQLLDPTTLRVKRTMAITTPHDPDVNAVVADSRAGRIYIGIGNAIHVEDANRRMPIGEYRVPSGNIAALAIAPDGGRLYVTTNAAEMLSTLSALDPATGTVLAGPVTVQGGTGVSGLTASAGGVWMQEGTGMTYQIYFHPDDHLASTSPDGPLPSAGGGWPVTALASNGVVWLSGTDRITCTDPLRGVVRASASIPGPDADAANIALGAEVGNTLYGYYQAAAYPQDSPKNDVLVRMTPPAACQG